MNLSFALNYAWGKLDPTGYRVVNLALHFFAAMLLMFASFWLKLRDEEKLMLQEFPERYAAYRRRAKCIIPFVL